MYECYLNSEWIRICTMFFKALPITYIYSTSLVTRVYNCSSYVVIIISVQVLICVGV